MIYIDKDYNQAAFDGYTIDYLKNSINKRNHFFPLLSDKKSYNRFSSHYKMPYQKKGVSYDGWLSLLMSEQRCRCCYCMKYLGDECVSIEHLIPKSANQDDYDFYVAYAPRLADRVELGSAFDGLTYPNVAVIDSFVKMPHMIAHSNLLACCINSSEDNEVGCSCNNHRDTNRILPLMLMADCDQYVKYLPDGNIMIIHPNVDQVQSTLESLDLNTETLKCIRHLWYLVSRRGLGVQDARSVMQDERMDFILQLFDVESIDQIPYQYVKFAANDSMAYWSLFLKYNWFYGYYKTHISV